MLSKISVLTSVVGVTLIVTGSAFAASPQRCQIYAANAVHEYQLGTNEHNKRSCGIQTDGRWQPNHDNHYNWCLAAPDAWLVSEQNARTDRLSKCGAIVKFDDN